MTCRVRRFRLDQRAPGPYDQNGARRRGEPCALHASERDGDSVEDADGGRARVRLHEAPEQAASRRHLAPRAAPQGPHEGGLRAFVEPEHRRLPALRLRRPRVLLTTLLLHIKFKLTYTRNDCTSCKVQYNTSIRY